MKISYKTKPLSPLLKATIKVGALDAVKLQIERGAQLNAVDSAGLSALMLAAIFKQPDIFQYLIEVGASLELIDSKGMSAIDYAEASGVEKIKEIIREVQNKTINTTSDPNLLREAISDQIINQSTESKIEQEKVSFKTTSIEFEDSKEIEKEQNLIQEVDSHLVDFELDEDLSFDAGWALDTSDHWCSDEEIEVPENDLACLVEAETIYNKIVNHQILDIDTIDWSDIEIDLPVSQQRIINIKDEFSHLYYLLIQSTIKGMVSYSQVLQAIKIDIGETYIDTVLPVILNLFGDLGVLIEDFKPFEANYEDDGINPSESLIEDSLINLNYELEGDLFSLNIYFSQIQKFELIDRDEEERIGLQMNIALLVLAKNIANLPTHYWSIVVDIFENYSTKGENQLFVEESEVDEETSVNDEIKNNEICEIDNGNSLEIRENNETLNFWDIVIQLRINNKFYESNQYIPRPKIKDLDKLLKIAENINMSAKRLDNYTESVRTLNQMEDIELKRQKISASDLLSDIEDDFKIIAQKKNIDFRISTLLSNEEICIDTSVLYRVLENVFNNAMRYAKQCINLDVSLNGQKLLFAIVDDGDGFSDETLSEQRKLLLAKASEDGHLGMGLAISRILCKKHGGSLEIGNNEMHNAVVKIIFSV